MDRKTEDLLKRQNELLIKINQFSVELSLLPSAKNLESLIIKRLKDMTGAKVAVFSEYDSIRHHTNTKQIEMDPGVYQKIVKLLGRDVTKIHSEVSDEVYGVMTNEVIGIRKTLYEASFGAISRPVSFLIKKLLKVDRFIGIAYLIEGKLFGTSLLAMGKDQPDLPRAIMENFIYIAGSQLRRKIAEIALQKSESRLKDIIFSIGEWIWEVDKNGVYTYSTQKGVDFFGSIREDIIGKTPFDFMEPEEAKRVAVLFSEIVNNKAPIKDLVNWNINKNGEKICLLSNGVPLLDDAGNLIGYRGVDKDITNLKKTEEALQESEKRYRVIVDNVNDGIFIHDFMGKILDVNENACKMLNYSRNEIIGKSLSKISIYQNQSHMPDNFSELIKQIKLFLKTV